MFSVLSKSESPHPGIRQNALLFIVVQVHTKGLEIKSSEYSCQLD